jgi:uncharacterized protein
MTFGQRALAILRSVLYLGLTFGIWMTLSMAAVKSELLTENPTATDSPALLIGGLIAITATLLATFFMCAITKEPVGDAGFRDPDPRRKVGFGFLWGGIIVALAVVVPWAAGHESLGGPNARAATVAAVGLRELGAFVPQSAAEEIFLRGYALLHLRRGIGDVPAVLLTGSLFGVLHLANPESGLLAAFAITLVGIFLGFLVVRTGSLWMAIGLHIAWNWFEGFFFGHPVSGMPAGVALIRRTAADESLWTGGAFGPEKSLPTIVILVACVAAVLFWRRRTKVA